MTDHDLHHDDHEHGEDHDEHDLGLIHDLAVMRASGAIVRPAPTLASVPATPDDRDDRSSGVSRLSGPFSRRRALGVLGGGALATAVLAACDPQAGTVTGGGCSVIPTETAGPYPGDGSNGPNVLTTSGVVRKDIRSSFGSYSGTAAGIPLTLRFVIRDVSGSCSNVKGAAVYAWHCTRSGAYSLYSSGITNQNYLRGIQASDSTGGVEFTTIFPGCYSGRWPHVHFEVFPSLAKATSLSNRIAVSQMALPEAICRQVYATSGYSSSLTNLNKITLATDNVFKDGATHQIAAVTGNVTDGYVATLAVGIP